MKKRVAIIGGGASGVLAAILLNNKYDVCIFERQSRILKKVIQSGNGMCNLTNEALGNIDNLKDKYNVDLKDVFKKFDLDKCKETFEELGLIIKKDNEGRYYPYSKKANSVVHVLNRALEEKGVKVYCDTLITSIEHKDKFILNNKYEADIVILASGSKASLNYNYNGYNLAKSLGLKITDVRESLVGLKCVEKVLSLSGIRIKANVDMYINDKQITSNFGEVQFKDDGLSGIVVMEESRFYEKGQNCKLCLDFVYDYKEDELKEKLEALYNKFKSYEEVLAAYVPKMLALNIAKRSESIDDLVKGLKSYTLNITSTYGFENAQVCKGGVSLDDVDINSFESKKVKGLYITGEVLDVDGTCGGYNLHFAWASAFSVSDALNNK